MSKTYWHNHIGLELHVDYLPLDLIMPDFKRVCE